MPNGTVFSSRVHRLENQQDGMPVVGIEELLLCTELRDMIFKKRFILVFRFVYRMNLGRPLLEIDFITLGHAKRFCVNFHFYPS